MKQILELCHQNKRIVIYGAGRIANILYVYLEQQKLSYKVDYFVVTQISNNINKKYGKKVFEFDEKKDELHDALIIIAMLNVVQAEVADNLANNGFSNYICVDEKSIVDAFYSELYMMPIQNNKIVFQNMNGNGYGCNPKYIAEALIDYMHANNIIYDLVWTVNDTHTHIFPDEIRTVKYGSLEYYRELATARVWIDNARKGLDVRKRKGQYYVQAWHGAAPIKKVERDVEKALPAFYVQSAKYDSSMADVFISGSEFYTNLYKSSFWYDGNILTVGLPRQDVFWNMDSAKATVRSKYGIYEDSIVLYAPTFRHDFNNNVYDIKLDEVKSVLEQRFKKKFIIMVSKHPDNNNVTYPFEGKYNYIDVCNYDDFQEILACADVLITDYSGCMYDYSYTQKPIFLYQKDYESYIEDRNFYIPMEQLPYIKANTNEDLIYRIVNFNEEEYKYKLSQFMNSMGNYDDGTASQRVADYIIDKYLRF